MVFYQFMFGFEFVNGEMISELFVVREEVFGELKCIIVEIFGLGVEVLEVCWVALVGWFYIYGLVFLVIHSVLHFPVGIIDECFVDSIL